MDSEFVAGPDGGLVEVEFEPAPDVDPRILGTYNGDGSMVNVDKINEQFPALIGSILWGAGAAIACFFAIWTPQVLLNDSATQSQLRGMAILSMILGFVVTWIVIFDNWHSIMAKLRFSISHEEAAYWQQNKMLRQNCRMPHSTREFHALLRLAQEADREKAPVYIAEQTANHFAQLVDQRGLWSQKASSAWLGPIVHKGILDAQCPGNDPDDEMSGASEE
jgi:hypothetical protein